MENPLLTGLNLVASGKDDLIAPTLGDDSYDEFQAMAEALIEAKDAGLIYDIAEQRSMSRKNYRHVARLLIPGGLTPKGKAFLKEIAQLPAATDESKAPEAKTEPEILQLRPTFAGMSIDLKALWKKWKSWRRQNAA